MRTLRYITTWAVLNGLTSIPAHAAGDGVPILTMPASYAYADADAEGASDVAVGGATEMQTEEATLRGEASELAPAAPSGRGPSPCDSAKKKALAKAAGAAYQGVFYNNDFSYLLDPCYRDWHLGESLKRRSLGPHVIFDVGGEYRLRYHSENNLRAKPFTGHNDDFWLQRTRLFLNAEVGERFRFYGEAIDATSNGHRNIPRSIEANRFDALNLFGDFKLTQDIWHRGDTLSVRGGRQELLYGTQRLVSPLDWSNTRRTFDGVKMFYQSKKWDVDGWWTRPVPFAQHIDRGLQDHNFDHWNEDQNFVGLWGTYKAGPGRTCDLYFLRLDDYSGTLTNANANVGDADFNLIGQRLTGTRGDWLYELEGGYQFGEFGPDDVSAGFFTLGVGRSLANWTWQPTLWGYYDWASGDDDPTDSEHQTFNQYFPLGHKYLGWMDIIARENIEDFNLLGTLTPCERMKFLIWYHIFRLEEATDALYNVAGIPIYQDPTGLSGTDIGQELDLLLQWTLTPRMNLWFGYSHFWQGDYFDSPTIQASVRPPGGIATNGANTKDADFFYTQFTVRF